MGLNISKGNMYSFVNMTWNVIKGGCHHGCSYCYMKRWGAQNPVRLDDAELKTDLGSGNFIFVGSSCDMWAESIEKDWIIKILNHCQGYDNTYLFQSKNPIRFKDFMLPDKTILTTTIETNRIYDQMNCKPFGNTPTPHDRSMGLFECFGMRRMITIEPIMDFDIDALVFLIKSFYPEQVNIGADSGNNHLPEPSWDKVEKLIEKLEEFTKVKIKPNLARLEMSPDTTYFDTVEGYETKQKGKEAHNG